MKFALAKKVNMTQVFGEDGAVRPVTVLSMLPLTAVQTKTVEKDGYAALQVGAGVRKEKNISKAVKGHTKGASFEVIKEFRGAAALPEAPFAVGDKVEVSSISKAKGFQGVVKRHGFHGGPRSHGQKHSEREPGSIAGGSREGGRVEKGKRMAGRMGGDRVTVKNLNIVGVEDNNIFVSGAVPGRRGTLVEVKGL